MDNRKKSFVGGMMQTQGLARTASQVFFKQEKTNVPIGRRKIFWINMLFFVGYFAGALAIVIMFFKQPASTPGLPTSYSREKSPDPDWGLDPFGNPCPIGGCTASPTLPATHSPTVATAAPA